MSDQLFELKARPSITVRGEEKRFPINRIFCVGQNYAAHAAEMGGTADYDAPFYFTKSAAAAIESGARIKFPLGTENYHHEMEFAVFIGDSGANIARENAMRVVFGYACALDMTRRDLQAAAKDKKRPWSLAKDFEDSAVFGEITKADEFGVIANQRITLTVNNALRQDSTLADLIHDVPAVIADLSKYYHLTAGDVILTGTPAGVGPVEAGDHMRGQIDGLASIALDIES